MEPCTLCPRRCAVDRSAGLGFCRSPAGFRVVRIALHLWEEPVLAGEKGAGAVFFAGCNLRCVYCQNRAVSRGDAGRELSAEELHERILDLQDQGAACIDLVTPTHYSDALIPVLRDLRPRLRIPVVYNCGGYESVDALRRLEGLIDVYLPDCKYRDGALSSALSSAPDYFPVCMAAIGEMLRQTGRPLRDGQGILRRGVLVRHLVLPGHRDDSAALLHELAERFGTDAFLLSLMSQYTPEFAGDATDPALHRRLTSFEYDSVLAVAQELGFDGFSQARSSASASYTPDF